MEFMDLSPKRKWEYMQAYYGRAREFYGCRDEAVTDQEVESCIAGFKERPLPSIRKVVKLRDWDFKFDREKTGVREGVFLYDYRPDASWEAVTAPHSFREIPRDAVLYGRTLFPIFATGDECGIWRGDYDTWYRTTLPVEDLKENQRCALHFGGVNHTANVWVNEVPVVLDHQMLFPFSAEVTDEMGYRQGRDMLIAAKVSNTVSNMPTLFGNGMQSGYFDKVRPDSDWFDDVSSGLAGDVTVSIYHEIHLDTLFFYTEKIADGKAVVHARLKAVNETWDAFEGEVKLSLAPWHPQEGAPVEYAKAPVRVLPMNDAELDVAFTVDNPALWDIGCPHLYRGRAVLTDGDGVELDDLVETFGIRTIEIRGAHFYLNNEKTLLRGTHDVAHYYDDSMICPSDYYIVKDILLHKKMGANCSRWPSDIRMHCRRIAAYCDQLGFMTSWTGYFEMWNVHSDMETLARRDVGEMVRDLRNHPSVLVWEMGDEPLLGYQYKHYRKWKWYELVYELVAAEDPSRPIIPAGSWSEDMVNAVQSGVEAGGDPASLLEKFRRNFPLSDKELICWDFHYWPQSVPAPSPRSVINKVSRALGGEHLTVFTEYGVDSIPEPSKVLDVYGRFRWAPNPNNNCFRREDLDTEFYGRPLTAEDWRESQACQAVIIAAINGYVRERADLYSAMYFMTMFDAWTFNVGAVDLKGNPKLAYYVLGSTFQPLYVSALHGDAVIRRGDPLEVAVSNIGGDTDGLVLQLSIKDMEGRAVLTREVPCPRLPSGLTLTQVCTAETEGLTPGLWQAELYLVKDGQTHARTLELFFVDE